MRHTVEKDANKGVLGYLKAALRACKQRWGIAEGDGIDEREMDINNLAPDY